MQKKRLSYIHVRCETKTKQLLKKIAEHEEATQSEVLRHLVIQAAAERNIK